MLSAQAGGHTAEMLALVGRLDKATYTPRCYVVALTDSLGPAKAAATESLHATVRQQCGASGC